MSEANSIAGRLCDFPACNKTHYGNGLCKGHWEQRRLKKELTTLRPVTAKAKAGCSFDGCGKVASAKGLCAGHYEQQRSGRPLKALRCMRSGHAPRPKCSFSGCGEFARSKGFCRVHCRQFNEGRTLKPKTKGELPYVETACENSSLAGPCHTCTRNKTKEGYVRLSINKKHILAHRHVWELTHGPITDNLVIDHMCRNRACINPDHLRLVTRRVNSTENVADTIAWKASRAKTHCPKGHEYNQENTYHNKGRRSCRKCQYEHHQRYREAKLTARADKSR